MATCWWVVQNAGTGAKSAVSGTCSSTFTSPSGMVVAGPYSSKAAAQSAAGGGTSASSGPGPNGRYSYAQLEGLWINAGGSPSMAPLMAAIAEAESSGNPNATGGVGEKGLWQINPSAWGSLATYDPAGNARAAVHVLATQGLTAWSTYTSGAYKAFLSGSTTPDTNVPTSPGGGGGAGGSSSATLASSSTRCLVGGNTVIPCLLDASQARGIIGGLCMLGGALVAGVGVVILVALAGLPGATRVLPGPAGAVARRVT